MERIKAIKEAIKEHNLPDLKRLAINHGFINNKLRKQAWPLLLDVECPKSRHSKKRDSLKLPGKRPSLMARNSNESIVSTCSNISNQSNHDQIEKDISRSAINFYDLTESQSESRQHLGCILHDIFDDTDDLHYIQGFNDVVSVFYAVCRNPEMTRKLSQKMATTFLKQYITGAEEVSLSNFRGIIEIVSHHDSELNALFATLETIHVLAFCVSWVLTLFAHEVQDIRVIARVYDYCLCNDESVALYLSAAIILSLKEGLLEEVEDDLSLHVFFQNMKFDTIDFDHVISTAAMLQEKYPPSMLSMSHLTPIPSSLTAVSLQMHQSAESGHYQSSLDDRYLMDDIKEGIEGQMDMDFLRESSSEFMSDLSSTNQGEHMRDDMFLFAADNIHAMHTATRAKDDHDLDDARFGRRSQSLKSRLSLKIPRGKFLSNIKVDLTMKSVPRNKLDSISSGFGGLVSKFKSKTPDPPSSSAPRAPRADNAKRLSFPGRQPRH